MSRTEQVFSARPASDEPPAFYVYLVENKMHIKKIMKLTNAPKQSSTFARKTDKFNWAFLSVNLASFNKLCVS